LVIPEPPVQVVPASGAAGVTGSTQFTWTGPNGAYVFHIEDIDYYEGFFIVTTRRTVTPPTFESFSLRQGRSYNWRVEKHGSSGTVDSLAGPDGYLDPFSRGDDYPYGPKSGAGTFSISTGRTFTPAP
jgi:hypothetical protein